MFVFLESRFPPDGSSAKTIDGELIKALAIATLCCSPPDNSLGLLFFLSLIPRISNNSNALFSILTLFLFDMYPGRHIFSKAENSGNRL